MADLHSFQNYQQLQRILNRFNDPYDFIPHLLIRGTQKDARELAAAIQAMRRYSKLHSYTSSDLTHEYELEEALSTLSVEVSDLFFFTNVKQLNGYMKKLLHEILNDFTVTVNNERFWVPKFTLIGQMPAKESIDTVKNLFNVVLSVKNKVISYEKVGAHPFHKQEDDSEVKVTPSYSYKENAGKSRETIYQEAMDELHELVGLDELKQQINRFAKQMKGEEILRKNSQIKIQKPTLHMIFAGSPGTGKTVVARIMAKILYGCGLIDGYHTVETDRSGLIGQYVGQTAPLVREKVEAALGGVLFIDEAYSLGYSDSGLDYGQEAIDTLMKAAEDNRENLCIILAGYENKMERLFERNEGMRSRFPFTFRFFDYTEEELTAISLLNLKRLGFATDNVESLVKNVVRKNYKAGRINGNARWIRNFTDQIIENVKI